MGSKGYSSGSGAESPVNHIVLMNAWVSFGQQVNVYYKNISYSLT